MGVSKEEKVNADSIKAAAEFLRSLANPNRLLIANALKQGERSVGEMEILLGIRQPSLSQQLAELRQSGLVETRRATKQVFYRLARARAAEVIALLECVCCNEHSPKHEEARLQKANTSRGTITSTAAQFAKVLPFNTRGS